MRHLSVRGILCALLLLLPPLGVLVSRSEARTSTSLSSLLNERRYPTVAFTFTPSTPQVGQVVYFNGSSSSGSDGGDIATWQWTFHDGTTDSGEIVTKTYSTAGTYSVRLTVTDFMNATNTTVQDVTVSGPPDVTPPSITVTPAQGIFFDSPLAVKIEWCDDTRIDSKSITFNGNPVTSQFTTTVGSKAGCGRYEVSQGTVTLIPGGNAITARASDGYNPATEVISTYTYMRPTFAPLDSATSIPLLERDLCLTIAAGDNAAYECGDLRIVHPLPGVRTMNKQRAPVLLYNSQHAEPNPLVAAHVQFSPTGGQPTTIRATLTVSGTTPAISFSRTWTPPSGTTWAAGQQRRIVMGHDPAITGSDRLTTLPTGVYPYTLSVEVQAGGQWTTQTPLSGSLVVVNRKSHPTRPASILGIPGWWVAGVEELHYLDVNRTQILWVGGDGSARVYTRGSGQTAWTAPRLEWSGDRITSETAGGVTTYVRHLPDSVRVRFNYAGQHVATVNRLGHQTTFAYTDGKLTSIGVPTPGTPLTYAFDYSVTTRVTIKPPIVRNTGDRNVVVGLSSGRVSYIRDPETASNLPTFGYVGTTHRIARRTDRRISSTYFTYDEGQKLRRARRQMDTIATAADLSLGFFAHETKGFVRAVRSDSIFTYVKGPRANVTSETYSASSDTTVSTFWIDRFGSPWRIRNALGQETVVYRNGPEVNANGAQVGVWPARVEGMQTPGWQLTTATYNARGNVKTTTVVNPYGDRRNATTRYEYANASWPDFVTSIVPPERDSIALGYDAAGNRVWQQDARGDSTRTVFRYYSNGLLHQTQGPLTAAMTIVYDTLGNVSQVHSPRGMVTTYERDAVGRDTLIVTPTDSLQTASLKHRQSIIYDLRDRVMRSVSRGAAMNGASADSLVVVNTYDLEGNPLTVRRWSGPDSTLVGSITTTWRYDRANRMVAEIAPDAHIDSTFYDRSGNAREVHTRRTDPTSGQRIVLHMQYDALDRLTQRIQPAVVYPKRTEGIATLWARPAYPGHPNSTGGSYRIAGDTARFAYDAAGNLTSAVNGDAKVGRSYYANGQLRTDTLRIRTLEGADFNQHVYALSYDYDLNGRRLELHHPSQLTAGALRSHTSYAYHPQAGALSQVTDLLGNSFAYGYDAEGRLRTLTRPGGIAERFSYSADGDLAGDTIHNGSSSVYKHTETNLRASAFRYDARGKVLVGYNGTGTRDTLVSNYTGQGHLRSSRLASTARMEGGLSARYESGDTLSHDALGNITHSIARTRLWSSLGDKRTSRVQSHGYVRGTGRLAWSSSDYGRDTLHYDGAGNLIFQTRTPSAALVSSYQDRASFYGADGKLRAADFRTLNNSGNIDPDYAPYISTFEEYRYDALGRRIWVRARRWCEDEQNGPNAECRISKLRRTIWDGTQELWEIQMPGQDTSSYLENDTGPVTLGLVGFAPRIDQGPYFGRVAYTHGLGVDQPLSLIRMGYTDRLDEGRVERPLRALDTFAIFPLWNERGQANWGVFSDGGTRKCQVSGNITRCVALGWPDNFYAYARESGPRAFWHGSLIEDKRDEAGTFYRRNRVYDPQSGRFTQEDPIGLAGGINLYGFANGDPVSYSDPYGLCPFCVAYGLFEAGSTLYDLGDLAYTAYKYTKGETTGLALGATAVGTVVGVWSFGGGLGKAAREGVEFGVRGATNLAEQLAARDLSAGVRAGAGVVLAGGTHKSKFRAAERFAQEYGGEAGDWVKKSTTESVKASNGYTYQIHWAENVKTGQIVDVKLTANAPKN